MYERIVNIEEQLRQNEKLSALGLLAAEVAHEIRNPLTVMKMLYHSLGLKLPADWNHFQPADLARLAEEYLTGKGLPCRNERNTLLGSGRAVRPFKAVITEVERRQGNGVVVRLDRKKTDLAEADVGFKVVKEG